MLSSDLLVTEHDRAPCDSPEMEQTNDAVCGRNGKVDTGKGKTFLGNGLLTRKKELEWRD